MMWEWYSAPSQSYGYYQNETVSKYTPQLHNQKSEQKSNEPAVPKLEKTYAELKLTTYNSTFFTVLNETGAEEGRGRWRRKERKKDSNHKYKSDSQHVRERMGSGEVVLL